MVWDQAFEGENFKNQIYQKYTEGILRSFENHVFRNSKHQKQAGNGPSRRHI